MLVIGGTSKPEFVPLIFQTVMASVLFGISVLRLGQAGFPGPAAIWGASLLVLTLLLMALQIVPLPFSIWSTLPGRKIILDSFVLAGLPPSSQPMTLSVQATRGAALALLPAVAGYLAGCTLSHRDMVKVASSILVCALLATLLAVLQKLQLVNATYLGAPQLFGSGFFANRNFFAAQLFCAIPFGAALAVTALKDWKIQPAVLFAGAFGCLVLLLVGLGSVGSRGGVVLSMISIFASLVYVFKTTSTELLLRKRGIVVLLVLMFFLVVQGGMLGLLRLANTDLLKESRHDIFVSTLEATKQFFPVGSGFGTFPAVYQIYENPNGMFEAYVNHAHNDWLEIVLEGGLPALALLLIFIILFLVRAIGITRKPNDASGHGYQRAAVVTILLLMLHAVFDFGLRTPALMSLFGLCCGMMMAEFHFPLQNLRSKEARV
jgi:O-antigen ligase